MTKRTFFATALGAVLAAGAAAALVFFSPDTIENIRRSGMHLGPERWKGTITVSGDTVVVGDLTVEPGTVVRFEVGDDRGWGDEVPADGYNDDDPTRLLSYGKTHGNIVVLGKLIAIASEDAPILFTSASQAPSSPIGNRLSSAATAACWTA